MASLWKEAQDGEGRTYYANTDTGESSWTKPEGFDSVLGQAAAGAEEGGGDWKEAQDAGGNTYYANTKTGESSWTKPAGFGGGGAAAAAGGAAGGAGGGESKADEWTECTDPSTGAKYYVNSRTTETSWTDPRVRLCCRVGVGCGVRARVCGRV